MNEIEPLPDELESLLAAERQRPDPAGELRTGLWSAIAVGLGTVPPPSAGHPLPGYGALRAAAAKIGLGKAVVIAAVAFGVGVGSGVVVDRRLRSSPPPIPKQTVQAAPVSVPTLTELPKVAPPTPAPSRVRPALRTTPKPTETHDGALAAERALLERAQTALSRGRPSEAYQAALEHEVDYPHGQLIEEREVLEVQSLVALGRRPEAEKAAAAFRKSHPKSLLLPALDETLGRAK